VNPRNDCPPPLTINYGSVNAQYLETGTIANYQCLEGFVLKGSPVVYCNYLTNTWPENDLPKCGKYINKLYQITYSIFNLLCPTLQF